MTTPHSQWATAVMPDGNAVVGFEVGPGSGLGSVVVLPLAGAGDDVNPADASLSPRPGFKRLFEGAHPDISPDGRYIAYQAVNESGRDEVYVRPYPDVERGPWQISTHGGTRPAWARNGRELFYIDGSMALMRVSVRTSASSFSMDPPVAVFDTIYTQPNPARHYDVSPDGGRFLMVKEAPPDPNNTPASLIVVQQWFEELRQRVGGQ
jgi:serine/threonine-protein kinase